VRQGASWTAAAHLQLTAAAVVRPVLVVLVLSCPGLLPAQTVPARAERPAGIQRSGVVAVIDTARTPAMASVAGPRPACGVHPIRCRRPGSSGGRLVSSCPVSGHLGHRPGIRRSGRPLSTVRCPPSGVRPSAVRPVRPDASGWSHPGRCGRQPSPQEPSRSRWAVPRRRAARSTAEQAWDGRRCGGAVGTGAGCRARWLRLPRGCRPRGWATTVGGGCGAGRRGGRAGEGRWAGRRDKGCGPGAAQADGGRSWLAAGSAVTCGLGGGPART
jgi:hypothetical protein